MLYTLTQADIDAYLSTKADHDTIGIRFEPSFCLLAEVLDGKYSAYVWDVDIDTVSGLLTLDPTNLNNPTLPILESFELSPEMVWVRAMFDNCPGLDDHITKALFLSEVQG